jgi:hypothetical protein
MRVRTIYRIEEGILAGTEIEPIFAFIGVHKGRLLKPWTRKHQLQAPLPAVRLPANPWAGEPKEGTNKGVLEERRFCVQLYIDDVKRALEKQGLVIMEGK